MKNSDLSDAKRRWTTTGQLGVSICTYDWTETSLGAIEHWRPELKTLVGLILNSRQPMFIAWGIDRVWLYNDAFIPIAGQKHPLCLGQPASQVWAESWVDLEPLFDQVWAGSPVHMDNLSLQLDRNGQLEEAHFAFSYTPAELGDGSIGGLFGTCIETTDHVVANRLLASDRQRLARLFDQAPTFMAVLSGPEHRIELANPRYLEIVGHRPVIGHTVAEALPDAVQQGYLQLLDSVYQSGRAYTAVGSKYAVQPSPGGPSDERYLDFVYQPIIDTGGQVIGIFVQGVDTTERRQMEIALTVANETLERRVEERTAQLLNIQTFYTHSSECHATLELRDDGKFEYVEINPATLRLYQMSRDEVIGLTVDDIFPPERAEELNEHLREALRQELPYTYSRRQRAATIEAVATRMPTSPGQNRRLAVTARDITERENLEEQLRQAQKMEAVGQLTGGIAHDFNNILQAIIGSLDRVQGRLAAGRISEINRFVSAAIDSAHRAATLTHRLLAFSRRQTLDPRPTDVNRLVAGMEDLLRRTVGPNIDLQVVGAGGLWSTRVDAPQLENALLNLCINARDAMPSGGKLTIETANKWLDEHAAHEREIPPGQYISVSVSDTGQGMEPHVVEHAFDPFFTTKPLGQGTGLGLSMIYGFARQSGGQIRIYTEVGSGTTMCLYLPRFMGALEAVAITVPENSDHGSGEKILIVDDEATVRMLVSEVLSELSYGLLEASDGPSALRVIEADHRIDLMITDVGLPGGINGRQLADAARLKRPDLKILFITGYAENAVINNGHLDHGMSILTKPFSMATLATKVRKILAT